jgi:preprotein translocase SecE subunit
MAMALTVYKKGQGTAARGLAGIVAFMLGAWASYRMYQTLAAYGVSPVPTVIGTALVAAVFGGVPLYLVLFQHQIVDILIETQQEMRKVAWSSRAEVIGSTLVVLATVILLAAFIFCTDQIVIGFFQLIRLYG